MNKELVIGALILRQARWVWGRKWDATRIIFTASRYLPFSGMVMTAYSEHSIPIFAYLLKMPLVRKLPCAQLQKYV